MQYWRRDSQGYCGKPVTPIVKTIECDFVAECASEIVKSMDHEASSVPHQSGAAPHFHMSPRRRDGNGADMDWIYIILYSDS